jgi:hypothetical protein
MLLSGSWLRDAKVSHEWGNNIITIQRTDTIGTIHVTKKLGPKFVMSSILEYLTEEDLMFAIELGLFSIITIIIPTQVKFV